MLSGIAGIKFTSCMWSKQKSTYYDLLLIHHIYIAVVHHESFKPTKTCDYNAFVHPSISNATSKQSPWWSNVSYDGAQCETSAIYWSIVSKSELSLNLFLNGNNRLVCTLCVADPMHYVLMVFSDRCAELIPGLRQAGERRGYFLTSLIGWAQT